MLAIGVKVLLFCYRLKIAAFFILWFLIGYNVMLYLMPMVNNMVPQIAANQLYQTLLPIAGGLLVALLGFTIEKICVGGICFALVMLITVRYFGTEMSTVVIGAIIGVISAGAAVTMMKPATIIATSAAAAYVITIAILQLAPNLPLATYYWPMVIGITVIGSIFQFVTTKHVS